MMQMVSSNPQAAILRSQRQERRKARLIQVNKCDLCSLQSYEHVYYIIINVMMCTCRYVSKRERLQERQEKHRERREIKRQDFFKTIYK